MEDEFASVHDILMGDVRLFVRFTVQGDGFDVTVLVADLIRSDRKCFSVFQVYPHVRKGI